MAKCDTIGCGSPATEVIEHGPADDRASDQVCTPCAESYERRPALRVTRRPVRGVVHVSARLGIGDEPGRWTGIEARAVMVAEREQIGAGNGVAPVPADGQSHPLDVPCPVCTVG